MKARIAMLVVIYHVVVLAGAIRSGNPSELGENRQLITPAASGLGPGLFLAFGQVRQVLSQVSLGEPSDALAFDWTLDSEADSLLIDSDDSESSLEQHASAVADALGPGVSASDVVSCADDLITSLELVAEAAEIVSAASESFAQLGAVSSFAAAVSTLGLIGIVASTYSNLIALGEANQAGEMLEFIHAASYCIVAVSRGEETPPPASHWDEEVYWGHEFDVRYRVLQHDLDASESRGDLAGALIALRQMTPKAAVNLVYQALLKEYFEESAFFGWIRAGGIVYTTHKERVLDWPPE